MKQLFHNYLYLWRYSAAVTGILVLVVLGLLYQMAGAWDPDNAPWYFTSGRAFIGMTLLITLLPAYFGVVLVYGYRRSLQLARIADSMHDTQLSQLVTTVPWKIVSLAAILGALFAVFFNIPSQGLDFYIETPTDRAIALGQLFIWTVIFCFIAMRMRIAHGFHHASKSVTIDIFEISQLRPFAQIGLIDVLIFAGGLVLSTVQSLDFSFRPDNYSKAIAIAVPAMLYLAVYPMWGIHKRMQALKEDELRALNDRILHAPKSLEAEDVNQLEILLQRRERVANCTTWPIDIAILQRFLFYIIIPPLAWIGAALVESAIDGFIGD